MSKCVYCSGTGICPYCAPIERSVPVYYDGAREITEEEFLALGEDNAIKGVKLINHD